MVSSSLVAVSLLTNTVQAWGPITHSYFACRQVLGDDDAEVAQCLGGAHPELLVGDGFPDAFVFGSFVVGSKCGDLGAYHNHAFASHLLSQAGAYSGSFNATAFALGYINHMTADGIGFYQSGPIVPRNSSYLDWLHVWQYMNSIDAYLVNKLKLTSVPSPALSAEGAAFVAEAAQGFKKTVDASVPDISSDLVENCGKAWQQVLKDKGEEALRMPDDAWQDNLVWFSTDGAQTWQEAASNLQPAFGCVLASWQFYVDQVERGHAPGDFEDLVMQQVADLFSSGACTSQRATQDASAHGPLAAYAEDDFPEDAALMSAFFTV